MAIDDDALEVFIVTFCLLSVAPVQVREKWFNGAWRLMSEMRRLKGTGDDNQIPFASHKR